MQSLMQGRLCQRASQRLRARCCTASCAPWCGLRWALRRSWPQWSAPGSCTSSTLLTLFHLLEQPLCRLSYIAFHNGRLRLVTPELAHSAVEGIA